MKKKYLSPEFTVVTFDTPVILAGDGIPKEEGSTLVYPDPFDDANEQSLNAAQPAKIPGDFKQK